MAEDRHPGEIRHHRATVGGGVRRQHREHRLGKHPTERREVHRVVARFVPGGGFRHVTRAAQLARREVDAKSAARLFSGRRAQHAAGRQLLPAADPVGQSERAGQDRTGECGRSEFGRDDRRRDVHAAPRYSQRALVAGGPRMASVEQTQDYAKVEFRKVHFSIRRPLWRSRSSSRTTSSTGTPNGKHWRSSPPTAGSERHSAWSPGGDGRARRCCWNQCARNSAACISRCPRTCRPASTCGGWQKRSVPTARPCRHGSKHGTRQSRRCSVSARTSPHWSSSTSSRIWPTPPKDCRRSSSTRCPRAARLAPAQGPALSCVVLRCPS